MNKNIDNKLDMNTELFIPSPKKIEYTQMPERKEYYFEALKKENNSKEKQEDLHRLILAYRYETQNNDGKYSEASINELIEISSKLSKDSSLSDSIGIFLLHEGAYCEDIRDFETALKFYQASLEYEAKEIFARYLQLNNLAFCLNYARRFEEAEKYLREAVHILPQQYNAWKNLGVSLEHLDQFEEAAECYVKALHISGGEQRSLMHLKRLVERQPYLRTRTDISEILSKVEIRN
jgi:tetratricopeptide (TPR) repeat protein